MNRILMEAGRDARRGRHAGLAEEAEVELFQTACADMKEASTHVEALELELRGPDGRHIATESIDVNDADFLFEFGREIAEQEPDLIECADPSAGSGSETSGPNDVAEPEPEGFWSDYDDDVSLDEERPFPRFQVMVLLADGSAIP